MSTAEPALVSTMRDHWWWRPGWAPGRSFYTWHITLADQPRMRQLADLYAPMLHQLPMLDPVPVQWLHLTVQGIGFTHEIDRDNIDQIVHAAKQRCAALTPFDITIGPPHLDPETIQLPATPTAPLHQLRATIRAAVADAWGADNVPEPATGWNPHVTFAYSNTAGSAEAIAHTLATQPAHTANTTIDTITLIELNRNNKMYQWTELAAAKLGQP